MKTRSFPVGFLSLFLGIMVPAQKTFAEEVAFSLQGRQLTWFEVGNPSVQGVFNVTGIPLGTAGNALSYDSINGRLLFADGNASTNHALYSVSLSGINLTPGTTTDLPAIPSPGSLTFGIPRELFGAGYYNGSYYTLINGTDTLVKVTFDPGTTAIATISQIDLPGSNTMFLGDLAFDGSGNLWISGYNVFNGDVNDDRLWRFSTTNGDTFIDLGALSPSVLSPPGDRYNGIFFDVDGDDLYGYRLGSQSYGIINKTTGALSTIYTGVPFGSGGDLSNGIELTIVPESSTFWLCLAPAAGALLRRRPRY